MSWTRTFSVESPSPISSPWRYAVCEPKFNHTFLWWYLEYWVSVCVGGGGPFWTMTPPLKVFVGASPQTLPKTGLFRVFGFFGRNRQYLGDIYKRTILGTSKHCFLKKCKPGVGEFSSVAFWAWKIVGLPSRQTLFGRRPFPAKHLRLP